MLVTPSRTRNQAFQKRPRGSQMPLAARGAKLRPGGCARGAGFSWGCLVPPLPGGAAPRMAHLLLARLGDTLPRPEHQPDPGSGAEDWRPDTHHPPGAGRTPNQVAGALLTRGLTGAFTVDSGHGDSWAQARAVLPVPSHHLVKDHRKRTPNPQKAKPREKPSVPAGP